MHWIGYLASVLIGVSLGLIGGGGSILTIPVLVYLFHIDPHPPEGEFRNILFVQECL